MLFGIEPLTYMISTFAAPYVVPKWFEHRLTLISGLIVLGFSNMLVGPFYTELSLPSMCAGLALSGLAMGFLGIPNMPEMMAGAREKHPNCDFDQLNSLLSGMLNAGFGIGQALGPVTGAGLYELFGFRQAMDVTAYFTFAYALLYFVCARGCHAISLSK